MSTSDSMNIYSSGEGGMTKFSQVIYFFLVEILLTVIKITGSCQQRTSIIVDPECFIPHLFRFFDSWYIQSNSLPYPWRRLDDWVAVESMKPLNQIYLSIIAVPYCFYSFFFSNVNIRQYEYTFLWREGGGFSKVIYMYGPKWSFSLKNFH